eukprot:SAG31_NODE_34017_length_337_cov_1.168067_1_plen_29_part_10
MQSRSYEKYYADLPVTGYFGMCLYLNSYI